jgi:hypothetical protein
MSEEAKSLLTLIGLIFASAGLSLGLMCWFLTRDIYNHEDQA